MRTAADSLREAAGLFGEAAAFAQRAGAEAAALAEDAMIRMLSPESREALARLVDLAESAARKAHAAAVSARGDCDAAIDVAEDADEFER